ncbi:hypothetical protein D9613_003318 [Agrocybe pediades]|uniref:Glyoxalase-like domain-containing protein n=1 Tax=Agrocybe pediades TaxID=84607 RepID=A0A8H4QNX5_9AGAR|nr:hypothetical protein D9613_003318 [Agrocybe pediades]
MSINTHILDHIVHLTPPGTVEQVSKQFSELGFHVLPGGTHADGLTANALVVFADGVYLELISFTHPASHYPAGSPERKQRDNHTWAQKSPGWIDYAFLGNGSHTESISATINERSRKEGSGVVYNPEQDGGRTRPDGQILKWLISGPQPEQRGILPFFCGDVTPRSLRVPDQPASNTKHPSTTRGIAFVRILVKPPLFQSTSRQLTSVVGSSPTISTNVEYAEWVLDTTHGGGAAQPRLLLAVPSNNDESSFLESIATGSGIYEVAFHVEPGTKSGSETTPYGKISWVSSK